MWYQSVPITLRDTIANHIMDTMANRVMDTVANHIMDTVWCCFTLCARSMNCFFLTGFTISITTREILCASAVQVLGSNVFCAVYVREEEVIWQTCLRLCVSGRHISCLELKVAVWPHQSFPPLPRLNHRFPCCTLASSPVWCIVGKIPQSPAVCVKSLLCVHGF